MIQILCIEILHITSISTHTICIGKFHILILFVIFVFTKIEIKSNLKDLKEFNTYLRS